MSNIDQPSRAWLWPLILGLATIAALLGALLWRGGHSLAFVAAFAVLLPAALATSLMSWWPMGQSARRNSREQRMRSWLVFSGVALMISAALTLTLGMAWSGSRLGNMFLVAGVLSLPPAVLLVLYVYMSRRAEPLRSRVTETEILQFETRAHWAVFFAPVLLLLLAAVAVAGPFGVVGLSTAAALYLIAFPGAAIVSLGAYMNSQAVLTDQRLLLTGGLLWRKHVSIDRSRLRAVGIKQTALGKTLGYGKVSAICDDGHGKVVAGLKQPRKLVDLVNQPNQPS